MHRHRRPTPIGAFLATLLGAAAIVGVPATPAVAKTSPPKITGAWARSAPAMAKAGAAYFTMTSAAGDRLVGVRVAARVAATAELHETVTAGPVGSMPGAMVTSTAAPGASAAGAAPATDTATTTSAPEAVPTTTRPMAMTMRPVAAIELPPKTAVALTPGGMHVMLMGLPAPLRAGTTITLTLRFAKAGAVAVRVPVQDRAP